MPYAEAVFDIAYFRNNPLPFYTLAQEMYPGKYRPTISHSFLRLLSEKGILLKVFTQNIDCLEREAGVPEEKIVEAHGSFAHQRCIECKTQYPDHLMKHAIRDRKVPHCLSTGCNGLVKPDIVFFGEQLPEDFHVNKLLPSTADLCIIMGTSLQVYPFAGLPGLCPEGVPRLLINAEKVGNLGSRADDVLMLGDCDSGVRNLAFELGWAEELEACWNEVNSLAGKRHHSSLERMSKDEDLQTKIAILTEEIDHSLKIIADRNTWLRDHLITKHNISSLKENDTNSAMTAQLVLQSEPSYPITNKLE